MHDKGDSFCLPSATWFECATGEKNSKRVARAKGLGRRGQCLKLSIFLLIRVPAGRGTRAIPRFIENTDFSDWDTIENMSSNTGSEIFMKKLVHGKFSDT